MCKQDHRDLVTLKEAVWKGKIPYHAVKVVEFQRRAALYHGGVKCYHYLSEEVGKKVNVITKDLIINDEWGSGL